MCCVCILTRIYVREAEIWFWNFPIKLSCNSNFWILIYTAHNASIRKSMIYDICAEPEYKIRRHSEIANSFFFRINQNLIRIRPRFQNPAKSHLTKLRSYCSRYHVSGFSANSMFEPKEHCEGKITLRNHIHTPKKITCSIRVSLLGDIATRNPGGRKLAWVDLIILNLVCAINRWMNDLWMIRVYVMEIHHSYQQTLARVVNNFLDLSCFPNTLNARL